MIDLNKTYVAKEDKGLDFTPAPEGEYHLRVLEISPWKAGNPQSIAVIQRDDKGKALKDEKGKNVTIREEGIVVYNSSVQLEIVGGEHEGKRVFHNLTTHPNAPFSIPSFLFGVGIESISASEIPQKAKGKLCYAKVTIESYDKVIQNKETGLEEVQTRKVNKIGHFKKAPQSDTLTSHNQTNNNSSDLGI